jgi:luciferase family oxidoreductase group 1
MLPLSVLDLSPVTTSTPGAAALRNSLDLARLTDRLGYTRYWLAEHHNLANIASSAPDIMIGQIAAVTERMRIGSGGVMLPNHAPLMVAERFKVLEALFPGRIDLGLGRAPGTDHVTSYALRRRQDIGADDDFLQRFQELLLFGSGGFPEDHAFRSISVMPVDVPLPPIWLLGSSDYSARLAGMAGRGFAFAHHFAQQDAIAPMLDYRARFKASAERDAPYAILAVHVVAADTDAEAERLAGTVDLNVLRRSRGEFVPLASPEEAAAFPFTPEDRERIRRNRERVFVGSPTTVKQKLMPLVEATQADEVMITSFIYDHAARKRSYEVMAQAFGVTPDPGESQVPRLSGVGG